MLWSSSLLRAGSARPGCLGMCPVKFWATPGLGRLHSSSGQPLPDLKTLELGSGWDGVSFPIAALTVLRTCQCLGTSGQCSHSIKAIRHCLLMGSTEWIFHLPLLLCVAFAFTPLSCLSLDWQVIFHGVFFPLSCWGGKWESDLVGTWHPPKIKPLHTLSVKVFSLVSCLSVCSDCLFSGELSDRTGFWLHLLYMSYQLSIHIDTISLSLL